MCASSQTTCRPAQLTLSCQIASTCPSVDELGIVHTITFKACASSDSAIDRQPAHTRTCPMTSLAAHAPVALQPLCDSKGRLLDAAIGWSSRPQVNCALHGHPGRRKRWNHWCITTPQWMLALTLADLDYLGYGAAYFLDLQTGQSVAHAQFRPFALGCQLPDAPLASHAFNPRPPVIDPIEKLWNQSPMARPKLPATPTMPGERHEPYRN